jgi:drug/metabolite transporter (DMT)-like permease
MTTALTSRNSQASSAIGNLYAIAAAVVFSSAGYLVRHIHLPAWDVSFWRSAFLVITLAPVLVLYHRRYLADARHAGLALVASAAALAGSFVSFILALGLAPVANVLIMFGATPFVTAIAARLFLGEPLHRHTIFAMLAATAGLALSVAGSLQAGAIAGMALAFVVVICMSINYVVVRHRRDVDMVPSIWLAGVISGLVAWPFAQPSNLPVAELPWILALSPGQLCGGLLLYMAALKRIPAGRAALLGLLELVLGPIWVWLLAGEKPDDLTLLGGAVVIAAAAANVWLDSRQPAR